MSSTLTTIFCTMILFVSMCTSPESSSDSVVITVRTIDKYATPETQALFENLDRIRKDNVLFGHQDDLAYGVNWRGEAGRSDVKDVTGSYPAVYGWDVGWIELDSTMNLDKIDFDEMRQHIIDGYNRGGVITISWHLNNPYTGSSSWDQTPTAKHIIPGGSHHEIFKTYLDRLAAYLGSLKTSTGTSIPIIFRPWHEHTGTWFWWSIDFTEGDEYAQLWQFTVEYLRDEKGLHNLLYAYSPSNTGFERMWEAWPGDDYVDIIGYDDYFQPKTGEEKENDIRGVTEKLIHIVEESEKRGKIPAFTETGLEALPDSLWHTTFLLKAMKADPVASRIAYVLTWRNSNNATDRPNHFYAPYAGHSSAADFVVFRNDPMIMFEDDLPSMYIFP